MNKYAPGATQSDLAQLEDAIAADTTPFPPPQVNTANWNPVVQAMSTGIFFAGVGTVEHQVQQLLVRLADVAGDAAGRVGRGEDFGRPV